MPQVTIYTEEDEHGIRVPLPSIAQTRRVVDDLAAEEAAILADGPEVPESDMLRAARDIRLRAVRQQLADRRALLEALPALQRDGQAETYPLRVPTLGELLLYEHEARILDEKTGNAYVDNAKLMEAMLPHCVQGMTPAQVLALSPEVGRRLWEVLYGACYPSPSRLPFSFSRSRTPSPAASETPSASGTRAPSI